MNVGQPNDRFEKEADNMADAVVQNKADSARPLFGQITPLVQRQPEEEVQKQEEVVQEKEEKEVQMKEDGEVQKQEDEEQAQTKKEEEVQEKEEKEVQMKEDGEVQKQEDEEQAQTKEDEEVQAKRGPISERNRKKTDIAALLKSRKGKGAPLPDPLRQKMEDNFGADFSSVRLHTDSAAVAMSKKLGAQAFASGSDIFFNQGKFDTGTSKGEHLLAHELTHTVQQGAVKEKPKEEKSDLDNTPLQEPIIVPVDGSAEPTPDLPDTPGASPDAAPPADQPAEGAAPEELPKEETPTPRSPEEDPNFQALKKKSKKTAKLQKSHPEATALADNAGKAAAAPSNEKTGQAQANQTDEMAEEEPKLFDAKSFKEALLAAIKKVLPKDEEEADQFPDSGKMDKVKGEASQKVDKEKQNAAGGIQKVSSKAPDTAAVPDRKIAELKPPQTGKKPGSLSAGKAMPPARNNSEVNQPLEQNSKELDDEMTANNVTDEQLARSEEPAFLAAQDSKKTAQEHAKTAPVEFRKGEQGLLETGQKKAKNFGDKQVEEMFGDRKKLFGKATENQQLSSKNNTSERERIGKEIDKIYQKTKEDVEKVIGKPDGTEGTLDANVNRQFELSAKWANLRFENYVRKEMDAYKQERYGSWWNPSGWGKRIKDTFVGLPKEVNQIYVRARERYLDDMDGKLTQIAEFIANSLTAVKKRINQGRLEVKKFVADQPANLQKIAASAASEILDKFNELDDAVVSKQEDLIDSLAQQYKDSLAEVDARIEEMKAANRGLIDKALDAIKGVIETIKKLRQLISDLLSAIASLIDTIMDDPIGFMKTLFAGIKQGIDNFKKNIQKHLVGGLFAWLTGALGPMGITIPDNLFSLSGIFNLVTQVLGLTWAAIRRKLLKVIPEPALKALEKTVEVFKLIKEKGIDGLWEFVKEKFTDLKETVIEAIKNMLITKVIQAGVKWLLSLLIPGAGFIKAIMAIKDVVVFFVESAIMLIPALIDGIKAAAAKNFGGIATAIENGIGKLIPLIIGLLARLLGISGLAKKVQKIIKKIRKRIDKQINKLVLKAKGWVRKIWKGGKKVAGKVKGKLVDWWKARKKFKNTAGESHTLFFEGKGKAAKLMIASKKTKVEKFLDNYPNKTSQEYIDAKTALSRKEKIIFSPATKGKKESDKRQKVMNALTEISAAFAKLGAVKLKAADYPKTTAPVYSGPPPNKNKVEYAVGKVKKGTKPPKGRNTGTSGWADVFDAGLTKTSDRWVQMHVVTEQLGGKGIPSNLISAPNSVNSGHFRTFEQSVASLAKKKSRGIKNVIWFEASVQYYDSKFAKGISGKAGLYLFKGFKSGKAEWMKDGSTVLQAQALIPKPKLHIQKKVSLNLSSGKDLRSVIKDAKFVELIKVNRYYKSTRGFETKMKSALSNQYTPSVVKKKIDSVKNKMPTKIVLNNP